MQRQASVYCKTGDHFTTDMQTAVRHPLWSPEEQAGLILRHHLRTADKSAGKFIEMTGGQDSG